MLTRRRAIGTAIATITAPLAAPHVARAAEKLVVTGHAVHKTAATTGAGGDITEAWRRANNVEIEWLTFGVEAANERALKEANLTQGNVDVSFLLDRYTGPQFAGLFENLHDWQKKEAIPDFAEIPDGMKAAHSFGGKLTAVPFRHATHGYHTNRTFLAERGIKAPPASIAEALAMAETLSWMREGTRVYGLVINMDDPSTPIDWVRGFGGDFITPDYKVVVDQPPAVRAMEALAGLFRKNAMPRTVMNMKTEDVITFMQQGRGAMTNQPFNRTFNYNDAKASKFPGAFDVGPLPHGFDGKPVPAKTSVWAMALPANAKRKELSWSLIRHLSTPEATVLAALNGNGPVRPSAYADPRVQKIVPYAAAEAEALKTARLVVPAFAANAKAMDMFIEEMGACLLGTKEPARAMTDLAARVRPLLPA